MQRANIRDAEVEYDPEDPEGYRSGVAHLSRAVGAEEIALKLFEIPPGQSLCPYHYEYVEEWLLLLDGTVVVRAPDGEHELRSGELVCFPPGPGGAHKLTNRGEHPARAIMFSSSREPSVAVYPDSDKIGLWVPGEADNVMLRRADGRAGYYDGEI